MPKNKIFDIYVKTQFSAGHHLRSYPGNCERPHGHNWEVTVTVRATELDGLGMGIDFRSVKEALKGVIADLDHRNLNEHPDFRDRNPSSENLAMHIFYRLQPLLETARYRVHSVRVCETPTSGVVFSEG